MARFAKHCGFVLVGIAAALQSIAAQLPSRSATAAMQHALHLADLYNWADAAKDFSEAETAFASAGDRRNALYARLGKIRATIEHRSLPATSAELQAELDSNPLLQTDKQLRMFCLVIKGDIDGEINSGAMRRDWEEVQALARETGDTKWQNRALAQLGFAAFYDGDFQTATRSVSAALAKAAGTGDTGAQIRFAGAIGLGFGRSNMCQQALAYFDNALRIAGTVPNTGYQYLVNEGKAECLVDLKQLDAAQRLAEDILTHARKNHRPAQEAVALVLVARIALLHHNTIGAVAALERSLTVTRAAGLPRQLTEAASLMADIYRGRRDLKQAEHFAELAAKATQESGDAWMIPQRMATLAELEIDQGRYAEADRVFDRADAFIDGMVGNYTGIFEKTALIRASSDLYAKHFALVAERFHNPAHAYDIIEQVRGRVIRDLLLSGSVTSKAARQNELVLSRLRLQLLTAHTVSEVRRIRDRIFVAEQMRWTVPGVSILKSRSHERIGLSSVQRSMAPEALILEYVLGEPASYCLMTSRSGARIVRLDSRQRIEGLAVSYLKAVSAKQSGTTEAHRLFEALIRPVTAATNAQTLVIVRDGLLHLLPFDAFLDDSGRYVVETHTVVYAPSASSFYLLGRYRHHRTQPATLFAVGGISYAPQHGATASEAPGSDGLADLPASRDEVQAAQTVLRGQGNTVLLGQAATESALKHADLSNYRYIHLAVHGLADKTDPDRAALVFLSDRAAGEDGLLHASEIAQLRVAADAVILSACDTAVGPVEGEEGIATLSRAFLVAGARTVISTLWSVDDTFSLFLMKQFYGRLADQQTPATALTEAKREMLRKFGAKAVPYYWAGFTAEGAEDQAIAHDKGRQNISHVTESTTASRDYRSH